MSAQFIELMYLLAAVLFILALKMMASPRSARLGNLLGAVGMLIAIVFTLLSAGVVTYTWIIVGLVVGSGVGLVLATTVKMTAMPQMVALLNGFGGLASGLVVLAEIFRIRGPVAPYFTATVGISTLIGWVTFTGSLVAFAKLQEFVITGRPVLFPRHVVTNLTAIAVGVALVALLGAYPDSRWLVAPLALLAAALGVLLVIPIGGADMPVVISLLNSYSGLAAAATGFVLGNSGLIIAGALVGASGIVLTRLMCRAMNRSLPNVLFGGLGAEVGGGPVGAEGKTVKSFTPVDAAITLGNASLVVIVPGYGMAVAQAQHAVRELAQLLQQRGVTVKFGIHPVAGRMPGHMNVLLAEAEVPYDQLYDMDQINPELDQADVAMVIGANDVINPAARHDKGSPIYGMPIINVDHARAVMVLKRSLNPGFAGIDNELFYQPNTMMIFGDAKRTVMAIVAAVKEQG